MRRTTLRRSLAGAVTAVLAAATALLSAVPAAADVAACDSTIDRWTPPGGSTDWGTPGNWSTGSVPIASTAVFIPAGDDITGVSGTACSLTVAPGGGDIATLSGSLTLDGPGMTVPASQTLALQDGTFTWPDGMPVLAGDNTGNGTIDIGAGATVDLQGSTTVGDITLKLDGGEIHGDPTTSPPELKQQDFGQLDWTAGTLSGSLRLDLLTNANCTACSVAASATMSTTSRTAFELASGSLDIEGTFVNGGITRFLPGTAVTGSGVLRNAIVDELGTTPPALAFGPDQVPATAGATTTVDIAGVHVDNQQQIEVTAGTDVDVTGATLAFDDKSVLAGPEGNAAAGSLTVGSGATVNVSGTTTMKNGFTLALDDGGDGTHATLHGATPDATLTATVTSSQPVPGSLTWASGSITGSLDIAGATTTISAATGSGRYLDGLLKFNGPANLGAATVLMRQSARIQTFGQLTLNAPGARFDPVSGTTGQSVTVESGGTLRHVPQSSTVATAPSEWATVNVRLYNYGRVELDASLDVPGGYSQGAVAHLATGVSPPVTALIGGSTLKSAKSISVTGGGVGGKGTLSTPTFSLQNAWIGPGYRANCHEVKADFAETCVGTITVTGALALHTGADVQVVVRSATKHDTLLVKGAATLTGKLTTATGTSYTPPYGVSVANVVRYKSRSGAFTSLSSPNAPVGLGWRPAYDDVADSDGRGVDVRLSDTQAPTIGFAAIPAFTQQNLIQINYSAVDNKTGVAYYDVRWRRFSGSGTASSWQYPKGWEHTTAKTQIVTGVPEGYTYCFQVRARDHAGNLSKWTAAPCTARMLDDRFLSASKGWTRYTGRTGWYDKTFTRTKSYAVTLKRSANFSRVAISAYRCSGCGTVQIYAGSTLLKTWNLASSKAGHTSWVSKALPSKTTTLTLKTSTHNRLVQIDAVGLLH